MRPSDWGTLSRLCVRRVFRCATFSLAPLLAPSPPHPVSRPCSATSRLLQRGPTSLLRASLAYGSRLPNAAPAPAGMGGEEISRFPCEECHRVPGVSDHAEPVYGLAMAPETVLPSRFTHPVGARKSAFAAQYPAHDSPHQRFTADLAVSGAWSGAGAAGYAFTVWNLHPLLLAGLPAHRQSGERPMPYQCKTIAGPTEGNASTRCPSERYELTTATASISIMKSGPARRVTPTVVLVGVATPR